MNPTQQTHHRGESQPLTPPILSASASTSTAKPAR
jgi:hypothetical protein